MADDAFVEPKASEEPYTRIKTLGRGAFGEAVLYRKTEVRRNLHVVFSAFRKDTNYRTQLQVHLLAAHTKV